MAVEVSWSLGPQVAGLVDLPGEQNLVIEQEPEIRFKCYHSIPFMNSVPSFILDLISLENNCPFFKNVS